MADPTDLFAYDEIVRVVKRDIDVAVVTEGQLLESIDRGYRRTEEISGLARELSEDLGDTYVDFGALTANAGSEEAPVLKVPEPMILKEGARVMSLTDGRNKMSKSDPNEASRIALLDPPELIVRKIKRAKTDPVLGLEFGNPERPEADNLLGLYALLSGRSRESAAAECAAMGWGAFKPLLAEAAVEALRPVQERYADLRRDPATLLAVLAEGRERARAVANGTLERVRLALGYGEPGPSGPPAPLGFWTDDFCKSLEVQPSGPLGPPATGVLSLPPHASREMNVSEKTAPATWRHWPITCSLSVRNC
jgi:hypothetical protein